MIKPIRAHGFRGMNNLLQMPAKLLDDERRITPSIILNAEVTDGGSIRKRGGYVLEKALTGCHSLAGEEKGLSVRLCVADGITWPQALYRVEGKVATEICEVTGPRAPVSYAEINNLVYMSSPYWNGVYDLLKEEVRSWGVTVPPAPDVSIVSGDLPPGTYSLCYTRTENGQLSGNGPLLQVKWEGEGRGIQLGNLPVAGQCWITHPDSQELFLATVVGGVVTGQVPLSVPLPSFIVSPPPYFTHFCLAFGRMWGVSGKQVYYSDSFQHEWFQAANTIPFLEDLVMVASVTGGLFVSSLDSTWFLDGTNPAEMTMRRIGEGAVPGTLVYAQLSGAVVGGGYEISRRQSQLPSPVWVSRNGFVAGTHTGHLVHMTEARLNLNPRSQGAGFSQMKDGIPRLIVSMRGLPKKPEQDKALSEIFTYGQLIY